MSKRLPGKRDGVNRVRDMRPAAVLAVAVTLVALGACRSEPPTAEDPSSASAPTVQELAARATGSTETGQGDRYWAVYLSLAPPEAAASRRAEQTVKDLGIASVVSAPDCDYGAADALDPGPRDNVVGVYFPIEADARAFADLLEIEPVGIAKVQTYCAD